MISALLEGWIALMRRCTLRPRALRGRLAPRWPALPLPRAEAAKTRGLTEPPHRVLKVQRDYVSVPQRHGRTRGLECLAVARLYKLAKHAQLGVGG